MRSVLRPSGRWVSFRRPALVLRSEELTCALTADSDDRGVVSVVRILINPDKLAGLDHPVAVT